MNNHPFMFKLYNMLINEDESIIKLNDDLTITIHNKNLFKTEILPKYFNSNNISNLNRQFYHYGFKKHVNGNKITYKNINLKNKEDLKDIKRKYKKYLKKPKNTITVFGKEITPISDYSKEDMDKSFSFEINLEKFN